MTPRHENPKLTKIPIPVDLAAAIDQLVGRRNRSAFATETVRLYLEQVKKERAKRANSKESGR
jgi:metal-responsive CopG/Arc/MetJ family transcriptional regulator